MSEFRMPSPPKIPDDAARELQALSRVMAKDLAVSFGYAWKVLPQDVRDEHIAAMYRALAVAYTKDWRFTTPSLATSRTRRRVA